MIPKLLRKLSVFFAIAIFMTACGVIYFKDKKVKSLKSLVKESRLKNIFYLPLPSTVPLEHLDVLDKLAVKHLSLGKANMARHKIVICGIARDNAVDLAVMMKHIEYIGKQFADYRVVVFENDSTDGTKAILKNWQSINSKVNIKIKDHNIRKRPNIKFLANARNEYIDVINSEKYNEFEMLMIVDMDMAYGFDIRGIQHSFAKMDQWDAVAANGVSGTQGKMYDAFAFRNEQFPWDSYDDSEKYWNETVYQIQKVYPISLDLVPVYSAFGGLAFYKRKFLTNCRYDSINNDCEHVPFHHCLMDNGGKMFMNPALLVRYSHYEDSK